MYRERYAYFNVFYNQCERIQNNRPMFLSANIAKNSDNGNKVFNLSLVSVAASISFGRIFSLISLRIRHISQAETCDTAETRSLLGRLC